MKLHLALLCTSVTCLFFMTGCGEDPEQVDIAQPTPAPETTVVPAAATSSPTVAATYTPAPPRPARPAEVHLTREPAGPLLPLNDTLKAYAIEEANQLSAGQLADSFIGDLVLENDQVRAVIGKPGRRSSNETHGGNLIDVNQKEYPIDYIHFVQTVPDLESTETQIVYDEARTAVEDDRAAVIVEGYIGEKVADEPDTAPLRRIEGLDVITSYSVEKHELAMLATTRFSNNTSSPVTLLPGDVIDWGGASAFLEGQGMAARGTEQPTNAVIATADDYSVGIVTSGTKQLHGFHTFRHSVVRGYGEGNTAASAPNLLPQKKQVEDEDAPPPPPPLMAPTPRPVQLPGTETSYNLPVPRTETNLRPPTVETNYRTVAPARPETNFRHVAPMRPETNFKPVAPMRTETNFAPPAPTVRTPAAVTTEPETKENQGGGDDPKADITVTSQTVQTTATAQADAQTTDVERGRLTLRPGESYEYSRYVVLSDADFSRITNLAYSERNITTGSIAGAVLEEGTNEPVPDVEIRISGGPDWNGRSSPRALTKTMTRADGTFYLHVPLGNYLVTATKVGRQSLGRMAIVNVVAGSQPLVPLTLTRESLVSIGVSEAESATSIPLPAKVTFVSKPGSSDVNWRTTSDVTKGVRNQYYLPNGGAHIPVSPGKYQVTISRGIEYDIVQRDVSVEPGSRQEILVSLPRVVAPAGVLAMDAGVMTNASSVSTVSARDRVIMAACEGVPVLISGDFNTATDLQPAIQSLNLQNRMRAFQGMRLLVATADSAAQIFVYPIAGEKITKLKAFHENNKSMPPDVYIADLKKEFPDTIIQIERPTDPNFGYFAPFHFDPATKRFPEESVPPPDFDAVQVMEGNQLLSFDANSVPYYDLVVRRPQRQGTVPPLAPTGGSNARLPFGEEVGFPRLYIYTIHDTIQSIKPEDIVRAIRNQHIIVTNGPLPIVSILDPATGRYSKMPGDVVNLATTTTLRLKINVLAAPWIDMQGFNINVNGRQSQKIEVMPRRDVLRYPAHKLADADKKALIVQHDCVADVFVFSTRRPLTPVVSRTLPELTGTQDGSVMPMAWTGPIYVDKDGDGKLTIDPTNI